MKFEVKCRRSNASQIEGIAPHDETEENYVGDYIDASNSTEAIGFAIDYLIDALIANGYDFDVDRDAQTITALECDEAREMYWGFTAVCLEEN